MKNEMISNIFYDLWMLVIFLIGYVDLLGNKFYLNGEECE